MDNPLAVAYYAMSVVGFTLMLLALIGLVAWGDYLKDNKDAVISHYLYYWYVFSVALLVILVWS